MNIASRPRHHTDAHTDFLGGKNDKMSAHPIDWKRDHELRTFDHFCAAAGLQIVPGSIRQPDPPAPDLIADIEGDESVAFELVRLNNDDQLTRLNLMHQTPRFLASEFAALFPKRSTRSSVPCMPTE